jgi:biopolymer transport protein ExbB
MTAILEMMTRGGIMMIPLLLTSIVGLAVFIERALFLRRSRIIKPEIIWMIKNINKTEDVQKMLDQLGNREGPFINIIRTGLENFKKPREEIKEIIIDQGRQESRTLERGLVILETVAGIAPLMGLLGTVLGMIKVFQVISVQGLGQTQSLSGGISEALITTVFGLSIAIPALVAYNYFNHRVEDLILEIEKHSSHLMQKLGAPEKRKE